MTLQEDRLKAQIVTNKNIVVEAGAGTGKTTLLIARLCISLLVAHVPAEKLVALTFTERAVAEIKTRLMEQLQKVIEDIRRKAVTDAQGNTVFDESIAPDEKNESTLYLIRTYFEKIPYTELLSRAEQAKTDLGRANIRTIHGFCAEILKLFPLEAGISPEVTIDNGQRGKVLFEAAWNTFLDKELGTQAPHRQAWEKILPEISLDALRCFAAELCSGKIEHYDYDACRNIIIDFLQKKSAQAFALSTAYLSPDCVKKRSIEKALIWAGQSFGRTIAFLTNKTDFPFIEEECPKIPGNAKPVKGWEATAWQEACSLIALAQKVTPEQQDLFLTAYGLVAPLVAQVRAQYAQLGLLSFDDLLVKTRNLLRDDLKVRRLLKEKFEALFIDEFQDTDPVQGEILLFLGEEKTTSAPCWEQVVLEPSKLFVVGDPKQSIYHFRGADISAYEAFTQMILTQGGEKCFLRENHRSLPEIIDTANAVCSLAMQEEPFFQPRYEPIFTNKQVRNQAVQWLFTKADPSAKADDFRQNQAEQIACWIRDNVGKMCLQNGKKLDYSDIALLARSNTTIRFYTDALRRHHIPFNAEINLDFLERQEINDLIMLLRAVSNPDDKTALAGVLRSPFGGFSDEEIYQIVRRGELSLFAKTQEEKLKDFYIQLNELSKLCGRLSPDKLLTYILQETFFPEACALAYEGERTLACLNQFAGLLQHYPAEQAVSLESFIVDVQQLQENPPKEFSVPCAEETLNAVSLLSVHKSKGLEAPVVILYDLSRKEKNYSSDSHLYSWKYHMHGVAVGKICDVNLAFLEEEKKKHTRCEEVRVLYVALTRAKEKLLLVGDGREQAQKGAFRFVAAGLFPDMENYPPAQTCGG